VEKIKSTLPGGEVPGYCQRPAGLAILRMLVAGSMTK